MKQSMVVSENTVGLRIDKYLSEQFPDLTRSYVQKLLKAEVVLVNGLVVRSNYKVISRDMIQLEIPDAVELKIEAEDIPLDIIYEDSDLIIINKPKGMVVHPAAGHYSGTLVNSLMFHCKEQLSGINGVIRPGIVHRIDMDTTGLLVVCKNDLSHNCIAEQLKIHSTTRKYLAVVHGVIKEETGRINCPIGRHCVDRKKMAVNYKNGRDAITHYKVIERFKNYTYIECQLETGRTHQIRVHMASMNHPLLGDTIYGPNKCPFKLNGQTLHAGTLGFVHPRTKEYMEFMAPIPVYFEELIAKLSCL